MHLPRIVLLAFLSACLPTLWAADNARDLSPLIDRLDAIRQEDAVPAFSVVLVDRDAVLMTATRGYADLAERRPAGPDTRFRIGSITKTFTGMALLLAESAGEVSLDRAIPELIADPPYENPWVGTHPITLAQLLEHTAGFQDWVGDEWNLNDPLPLAAALAYRPGSRTARWPPGFHSSYSNSGAGVAARVFELLTDSDFESFVDERIFTPLGMDTATFLAQGENLELLATGYDSDGTSIIPYWHVIFRPAAAISLRPDDMAALIRLLLNRGRHDGDRFLTPDLVSRMEHPRTTLAARAGLDYGYGLGIYQWQHNGHSLFGHGGDGDGYLAHFGYSLESGRGYFVVINVFRYPPLRRLRAELEDWVTAGLRTPSPVIADASDLTRYTGTYRQVTKRFGPLPPTATVEVLERQGRLYTKGGDSRERPLLPVAEPMFRRPGQTVATTIFVTGGDGRRYLQGPIGNFVRIDDGRTPPQSPPPNEAPAAAPSPARED